MIPVSKPVIGREEISNIIKVLKSGQIAQGPKVALFEKKFAQKFGAKYAVALSSGTASLHTALYVLGVKPGDEVITSPFTFMATAGAILMCGAKPVFVDIDEKTFNLNPALLEKNITKKTKVILPVDLYGQPYDSIAITKIAKKYGIKVVEDACQAHGAKFGKKYAGTLGDIGVFSLYATKNMTTGEGGMLLTDVKKYADKAREFRQHGQISGKPYEYFSYGVNYSMTDLEAAMGLVQLGKLDSFTKKRNQNAKFFSKHLIGIKGLKLPLVKGNVKHVFHQYTIRITKDFKVSRDKLKNYLKEQGISSSIFYSKPLYLHKPFLNLGGKRGNFPITERITREVLSLPVHPSLSKNDLQKIVNSIKKISK